jgi:S-adenosylmethionine hydrolase
LALVGSDGALEIAVNAGSAHAVLNLATDAIITIR